MQFCACRAATSASVKLSQDERDGFLDYLQATFGCSSLAAWEADLRNYLSGG